MAARSRTKAGDAAAENDENVADIASSGGVPGRRARSETSGGGRAEVDILEVLRQGIATHSFAPGSRLRESELAEQFGVSRAKVRDAFGILEERGLIVRIPNRGAMVTRLEPKQVFEIFDVRERLEGLCARAAATNAPHGAWDSLRSRFVELSEIPPADSDFQAYLTALVDLRKRMIQYADNAIAANMLDLIYDKAQVIARRVVILPGRITTGLRLHSELIDAFIAKDPDEAERIKRYIISSARDDVRKFRDFIL